jgi:undecaprenyl-diphosphatase
VKQQHLDQARAYLARRGGRAVFLGRFTASLRALVPGLAGLSGMPYRTFATWNIVGGTIWATSFVVAGYLAGSAWKQVEAAAGRAGFVALGLVVVVVLATALLHRRSRRSAAKNFVS